MRRAKFISLPSILAPSSLDKTVTAPRQSPPDTIGTMTCAVMPSTRVLVIGKISPLSAAFAQDMVKMGGNIINISSIFLGTAMGQDAEILLNKGIERG